jgi:hypothetical protein
MSRRDDLLELNIRIHHWQMRDKKYPQKIEILRVCVVDFVPESTQEKNY